MWIPAEDQSSKFAGRTIVLDADCGERKPRTLLLATFQIPLNQLSTSKKYRRISDNNF
jgi:hypothetical protein